eukprot:m.104776 g.104776  ORF g.104776 m.104776 type:complete len:100 (+) comp15261_c0_seq1:92-391(+)
MARSSPLILAPTVPFDAVDGRDPDLNVIYDEVNKHVFIVRNGGSQVKVRVETRPLCVLSTKFLLQVKTSFFSFSFSLGTFHTGTVCQRRHRANYSGSPT